MGRRPRERAPTVPAIVTDLPLLGRPARAGRPAAEHAADGRGAADARRGAEWEGGGAMRAAAPAAVSGPARAPVASPTPQPAPHSDAPPLSQTPRPWSPSRALGSAAAYAAQSFADVFSRSLSPTLHHAASLFDSSGTVMSPMQLAVFDQAIATQPSDAGAPEMLVSPKSRETPSGFRSRAPRRVMTGAGERRRGTGDAPAAGVDGAAGGLVGSGTAGGAAVAPGSRTADGKPARGDSLPRLHARRAQSLDTGTPVPPAGSIGHVLEQPPRLCDSPDAEMGETAAAVSSLVAPQARRGAVWLHMDGRARRRRRARRPSQPRCGALRTVARTVCSAATLLVHPREAQTRARESAVQLVAYWDDAFRDTHGARCWRPPWMQAYVPLLIWLGVSVTSSVLVLAFHTRVFRALDALSLALRHLGLLGRALFGLMIFVTTFPPFPLYSTLVVLSGFAFGMWQGFLVSYVAALSGALAVFVLSRTLLRTWMVRLLRQSGGLQRVVRAIEKRPRLLFLVRLAPYPYNLLNTLLASSSVLTLRTYMTCTALALVKLLVHAGLGASIQSFAAYHGAAPPSSGRGAAVPLLGHDATPADAAAAERLARAQSIKRTAFFAGVVLCIGVFAYLYWATTRAVDEELDEDITEYEPLDELGDLDALSEADTETHDSPSHAHPPFMHLADVEHGAPVTPTPEPTPLVAVRRVGGVTPRRRATPVLSALRALPEEKPHPFQEQIAALERAAEAHAQLPTRSRSPPYASRR
ncbi:hypothetical protein MSPP1_002958 [Malassezia sp. CBS 17886]|nr:hypothetical protein MSPP1_002958 [Malassezia sp. CBS 17886]